MSRIIVFDFWFSFLKFYFLFLDSCLSIFISCFLPLASPFSIKKRAASLISARVPMVGQIHRCFWHLTAPFFERIENRE